jgi:hypothetical protein
VAFAQDIKGRHVVLKLSKIDSVECAVYDILARDKRLLDVESFPGVLPPLGFIQWGNNHRLIILPRCVNIDPCTASHNLIYVLGGTLSIISEHPF